MAVVVGWAWRPDGGAVAVVGGTDDTHPQVRLLPGVDVDVDLAVVLDMLAHHREIQSSGRVRSARERRED
jgi:hypothetical protein